MGTLCMVIDWKIIGIIILVWLGAIYLGMYIERWLAWNRYQKGLEQEVRNRRYKPDDPKWN